MTTTLILSLLGACAILLPVGAQLNITCYPNGTLLIENPDPEVYVGGYANDSDIICNMTFSDDNTLIAVSGCAKDDDILVQLSNATSVGVVLGGSGSILYIIRCDELVSEGIEQTLVQKFTPHLQSTVEPSATPTMPIGSNLRLGSHTGTIVTTAQVGDELFWTLDIPVEYTGNIMECSAYAGSAVSGSVDNAALISGSCSADEDLSGDFTAATPVPIGGILRYYTTIYAFKFYSSQFVTFSCNVKLCPGAGILNCVMPTCPTGRRRRDVPAGDSAYTYGLTATTYRVLPKETSFLNNGAKRNHGNPALQILVAMLIIHGVLA